MEKFKRLFLLKFSISVLPRADRQLCYDEKHLKKFPRMWTIDLQCFFSWLYLLWVMIYPHQRWSSCPLSSDSNTSISLGGQRWSRRIGTNVASTSWHPYKLQLLTLVSSTMPSAGSRYESRFFCLLSCRSQIRDILFTEKEVFFREQYTKFTSDMSW